MDDPLCAIDYCDRPVHVKRDQLCCAHYQQKKSGRPFTLPRESQLTRDELGRKRCRQCREWLAEDSFGASAHSADGRMTYCRPCARARQRAVIEHRRDQDRAKRYNMTRPEFDALLAEQGGRCAICQTDDPGTYHHWCVDHDHRCCPGRGQSCGRCVRGILCPACNKGIGLLGDNFETLRRAATYVERMSIVRGV
jgi:hypothetical protein